MTLYTAGQIKQFAYNAGFRGDAASRITAISLAESGGQSDIINYNDPQGSYGLTQINQKAHGPGAQNALDPQNALDQAYTISNGGADFSPWSTYKTGADLRYLSTASSATAYTALADGNPDQGAGFRMASSAAPAGAVGDSGISIEMVDPATGSGALTGSTDAGGGGSVADLAQTAAGLIPGSGSGTVTVQAGNTVQKLVTNAENYVGNTVRDAGQAMFGWMPNFAVRFFLILGALVIAAVALWRLTETGGNLRQILPAS